MVTGEAS